MARLRADKRPGLFSRVRWANLGRSAALLAAGLIVFTRGCGGPGEAPAARIPAGPLPPAVTAPTPSDDAPVAELRIPDAGRPRRKHHRKPRTKRVHPTRRTPQPSPAPPPPAPARDWAPPPLPEWGP